MKISEKAVRNYQFTIILFLLLIALGVYSFMKIPQAEDPEFPIPIFPVIAIFPGASPADMEQLVVDKVEEVLNELEDIETIETEIKDGVAVIVIEFSSGTDPDRKFDELLRQINSVRQDLPKDLYSIEALKIQAGNTNIIQSALVTDSADYSELSRYADELVKEIRTVPGVRKAEAIAFPEQELRIALDLNKMSRLKINVSQVIGAIQSENSTIPGGSIEIGPRKFNVKTPGGYKNIDEVGGTIVGTNLGSLVYLRDIATVSWQDEDPRYYGRYNGKKALFLIANMKGKQNIHLIRNNIYSVFDSFEKKLPSGIVLERGFDQSQNVKNKLGRLQLDFLFAFLLVLVTLLPLGIRASGVVMISIPLSILIGVTGLYLTGFSINQLTIVGAVIALGLLVDDSIVVVENISRWVRGGTSPYESAILATKQIGPAVLGCTATLILAFLPLMFLPGMAGQYMRSLPASVTFIVIGSLLVALTIIPFIASKIFVKPENPGGNRILRGMNRAIDFTYGTALKWCLVNPLKTVLIAGFLFISSLFLINIIGFSLFPKAGLPQFLITVESPRGSNINETDRAVRFVESVLKDKPEVNYYMSNIGKGNPMIFYNSFQKSEQSTLGEVMVEIKEEHMPGLENFIEELRDTLNTYVNARIYVYEFENGMPVDAPVAMRIVGNNLDSIEYFSEKVENILGETPGTIYVRNPLSQSLTDLKVKVNSDKAGIFGVLPSEIDKTIRLGLEGITAGEFRNEEGKEFRINVRLPGEKVDSPSSLGNIYVASLSGHQVPLSQLASVEFYDSPTLIQHYNNERSMTVTASVRSSFNTDKVTKEILYKLRTLRLPEGFSIIPAGEIEGRRKSFGGIGTAILIAVFGIFAILVIEFGTFRSTLIVLSVIPLGFIGGITMLYLTGYTLSFSAAVGFVALTGIEIKNSILLVDFTNQLRQHGTTLDEAIVRAGEIRFLPVILTTLTAIGGLMPIALGHSNLYSPLAYVIIGGLITSTLFARLVTPVMYRLLPPAIGMVKK
ncbi:MAG TPA: efflux RND transporter permease subunit [Bacteroidales bacterium]|nr:efflux RND transporter permease subunit [Bacteroidales bacterium]